VGNSGDHCWTAMIIAARSAAVCSLRAGTSLR
jgi:hypothetical protein